MEKQFIEQRKCKRKQADQFSVALKPLDPQVWFRYWNGTECSLRDLSFNGAGVYSREDFPAGTRISIDILLDQQPEPIKIFGKIVWSCSDQKRYRIGISFSWWKNEQKKKLISEHLVPLDSIA